MTPSRSLAAWNAALAPYARPDARRSALQLATTLGLLAALVAAAYALLPLGLAWALLACVPAGLMLTRLFVLQHDCGHQSFFASRRANDWTGRLLGVLTLTPYLFWKRAHDRHHASCGDLSRRGVGDIDTLTVREYRALGRLGRLRYRVYRHPLVLFLVAPVWLFVVLQRIPYGPTAKGRAERASVLLTNLGIAALYGGLGAAFGFAEVATLALATVAVAATAGLWLFYVQHQHEGTYWAAGGEWSFVRAALQGSSFYDLPRVLHWATGYIGYHHVHHLCSRVPNYNLRRCHEELTDLRVAPRIGLAQSLATVRLRLWDEDRQRLVSFRDAAAAA